MDHGGGSTKRKVVKRKYLNDNFCFSNLMVSSKTKSSQFQVHLDWIGFTSCGLFAIIEDFSNSIE